MNAYEFNTIMRVYRMLDKAQPGGDDEVAAVGAALGLLEGLITNHERLMDAYAEECG